MHFGSHANTSIKSKLRPSNSSVFTDKLFLLTYLDDSESRQQGRQEKESEANQLISRNY